MQTRVMNPYTQAKQVKKQQVASLVRGTVVRNDDPLNIGRIKVRVPSVHIGFSDDTLPWCMPNSASASYNAGTFIIPEVNNTVWVAFEDGDIYRPVWLGCAYSGDSTIPTQVGNTSSDNKRFKQGGKSDTPSEAWDVTKNIIYKSSSGAIVYTDESDSEDSLVMRSANGDKVLLGTGTVSIETSNGITLELSDKDDTLTVGVDDTKFSIDCGLGTIISQNSHVKMTLGEKVSLTVGGTEGSPNVDLEISDTGVDAKIDNSSFEVTGDRFYVKSGSIQIDGNGNGVIGIKTQDASIKLDGKVIDLSATTVNINAEYVNIP